MNDQEPDLNGFDGVLLFLALLIAGIVGLVATTSRAHTAALIYGTAWLMFDSGN